jgi:cytochrome c biogenesis protein CcdA/thiol-disulfide isomerase/thioredoxin
MTFLILSFIAGILTVLAPCVLPLLPVIVGGSLTGTERRRNPLVIALSLSISVIAFTLILKWSTALINIPPETWSIISGSIIIFFGLTSLLPNIWEKISGGFTARISRKSNQVLATGYKKKNAWGDVIMGAALGPVFSSCSPTYFVILASVLPQSFFRGLVDLIAYSIGLSLMLFLISVLGQKLVEKIGWAVDPEGWFKRGLGILFILVGIFIIGGFDKKVQSFVLGNIFDITKLETSLLKKIETTPQEEDQETEPMDRATLNGTVAATGTEQVTKKEPQKQMTLTNPKRGLPRYKEIKGAAGYVNSDPFTIGQYVGKKVILLDIMTYSCINCQRTFPYVTSWYKKYQGQGFIVIGIHTPEFAFEKNIDNVREAMKEFGITFPVVLDNDYATWNAYGNNFWPRKYLIDIYGNIVYDHIGEGEYDVMEKKIQEALKERAETLKTDETIASGTVDPRQATKIIQANSPETYFGYFRNTNFGNGSPQKPGAMSLTEPAYAELNKFYLSGPWNFEKEYAENTGPGKIIYRYNAKNVFFVASSKTGATVKILQDGKFLKSVSIKEAKLYELIKDEQAGPHLLEVIIDTAGLEAYTFTFG